ncbi:30S ribosome-binding factor RbfA [Maridesulfovibrio hydrothermalis]|uniref:Ribosome-binding factor A n=1 Tax=Maridesulfovibrio hydrothermalis AM13 = DSM 14728 TaxID=1121451 RepID=L0RCR4_9BACT|nr:30S ribosome-binding factor RbfA [Maridesulfovibrio hydrothermalis]CCO23975.1 Ribosome-binding factor A [Maridesulfovibrio hydrothermalis AM13 = DSM 14728]
MKTSTSRRSVKMADQIMREIATMLIEEIADPRLEMVSISGVRMNKDNKIAEVMFTMSGDKVKIEAAVVGLNKAKGFIRSKLSKRIRTRQIPELRFVHDNFLEEMVYGSSVERNMSDS